MAYSVTWTTRVISIPDSDLTLVSGTEYELNMSDFLKEIRRLEWSFTDGFCEPQILEHTNAKTLAGVTYAPFDEVINGYTVQFSGPAATRVNLKGSNNNIADVLIANGVTVVPSNSAGLQIVSTGSGVTAQDKIDIAAEVLSQAQADPINSNIKEVNDTAIAGSGTDGDPWGP